MARRNGIWYEGRVINNTGQCSVKVAKNGRRVLEVLVAEDFRSKNKDAPKEKQDPAKGSDDYVTVATAWHRVKMFDTDKGDPRFDALITNPDFNHGAVVVVDASYQEDSTPWVDKNGVTRISRSESIFLSSDDPGTIDFKDIDGKGKIFGAAQDYRAPLWDGVSTFEKLGGSGGGSPSGPDYGSEGF